MNWWDWDEGGLDPIPKGWRTWWELLVVERPAEPAPDPEECTGFGNCHGCLKWCSFCGDVSDMCDGDEGPPGSPGCDTHHKYPLPLPVPEETGQLSFIF